MYVLRMPTPHGTEAQGSNSMVGHLSTRLRSLDALRGVAAAVVVLYHCCQSLPGLRDDRLLHHLLPGSGAVLVFFVLSGLVLGMTFVHRDGDRYAPFAIKRITRIWPTFAVAILASAALSLVVVHDGTAGVTDTIGNVWAGRTTWGAVVEHLAMTGTTGRLDPPMWSLVHEMRISLAFPLLVWVTLLDWRLALVMTAGVTFGATSLQGGGALADSLLMTSRFAVLFVMGIIIALRISEVRHALGSLPRPLRLTMWGVSLAVLSASPDFSGNRGGLALDARILVHGSAAAAIVMLCATEGTASRWLATAVPTYLGRISYSLYLWHIVAMTWVVEVFAGRAPPSMLVAFGAVLAVGVADVSERFVERPTTRMGRALARLLPGRGSPPTSPGGSAEAPAPSQVRSGHATPASRRPPSRAVPRP